MPVLKGKELRIVGFLCNWCSYGGADTAGVARAGQPTDLRIIRVPCSGRIDPLFIVKALLNGQVDCVVIDNAPAQEYVKANPGLKILDTEFANEDYAIGVAKGNTALLDAINGALKELIDDGTVQSIIDKYIPAEAAN